MNDVAAPRGHQVERLALRLPIEVVGNRGAAPLDGLPFDVAPQLDEAIGLGIRQRPQRHRIQQPEHRRRRANAEGQREHGAERRGRRLPQRAPGKSQIADHASR